MKLGFIGTGNMAGAIMGGVIKSNVFKPEEIIGADLFAPGREKGKELYGIAYYHDRTRKDTCMACRTVWKRC